VIGRVSQGLSDAMAPWWTESCSPQLLERTVSPRPSIGAVELGCDFLAQDASLLSRPIPQHAEDDAMRRMFEDLRDQP
jgi:hypothetical protein